MEKAPFLLTVLTIACSGAAHAAAEPGDPAAPSAAPQPAPARTDDVRAEVAQIMAAAQVLASAPLAPVTAEPTSLDDEKFLAGFRAMLRFQPESRLEIERLPLHKGPLDIDNPDRLPSLYLNAHDEFSITRDGLGWLIGGANTRLTVHAAYLRGVAGDPNSATAIPSAGDAFDSFPAAEARRQFVLTLQAQFVF